MSVAKLWLEVIGRYGGAERQIGLIPSYNGLKYNQGLNVVLFMLEDKSVSVK